MSEENLKEKLKLDLELNLCAGGLLQPGSLYISNFNAEKRSTWRCFEAIPVKMNINSER